tara:strand:- start:322 stop:438 length:117 start_codon:yes stop_codon:yes gene_type:complete
MRLVKRDPKKLDKEEANIRNMPPLLGIKHLRDTGDKDD